MPGLPTKASPFEAEAPAASLVVISQTYYPAWKAYVDGRPAKLWRANYAFQALEVPAGRHHIRLAYEDEQLLRRRSPFCLGSVSLRRPMGAGSVFQRVDAGASADIISSPCTRLKT